MRKRKFLSLLVLLMTAAAGAWAQDEYPIVYDFEAAANAGENPANNNGSQVNGQLFYAWESESSTDKGRQDYKGYTWAEGSVLPKVCHVWPRERINGNVSGYGGLNCPSSKQMAIDGLTAGLTVTIIYDASGVSGDSKELLWAIGNGSSDANLGHVRATATINGVEAEPGKTAIKSGDVIIVNSVTPAANGSGYIVFKVMKGMIIKQVIINDASNVEVTDITAADITAPTAVEDLQYRAMPQELIVAGSVTGGIGTMYYSLDNETWSTDVPTATDQGEYTVYWKVVGDYCHNDYVPDQGITVTIGEGAGMAAQLTVTGNSGTSCTARLLDTSYQPLASGIKVGEKFILSAVNEDDYDFSVTGASTEEFSEEDYLAYYEYATSNGISVSLNSVLLWVTMPYAESGTVDVAVGFKQLDTYTILYQPASGSDPEMVACKLERSVNNTPEVSYIPLQRGATMGDGKAVWSTKITVAFAPTKIAFVSANKPSNEEEVETLASTIDGATLNSATISQNTTKWNDLSGAKYLIIGGNAKVVTAAFIADANSMTTYQDNTVDAAENTGGVTYQLVACVTDEQGRVTTPGTVTAPAAPTTVPTGKEFAGWRGFQYDANGRASEKIFTANETNIIVRENATFYAVWNPAQVKTTFAMNGGTGFDTEAWTTYGQKLSISGEPTRQGFVFDKWTVAKAVSESGVLFSKGSQFDMNTALTANLDLTAQWKHVHKYGCFPISAFGDALAAYQKYSGALHIAVCGCYDINIVAHEFNKAGRCACGYVKPGAQPVKLEPMYGQLNDGNFQTFALGLPEDAPRGSEVKVDAPHNWGNLEFQKWQYSTDDGATWEDLAAFEIVGFHIPCDMKTRALYVNPVTTPTIELATSHYDDKAEYQGKTYTMGNILYQMNYKLPDGYQLLDAGIRMGDNGGISYYFIQQVRYKYDNESKGILAGIGTGVVALGVGLNLAGSGMSGGDAFNFINDYSSGMFAEKYGVNYLETEDNVMEKEKMDAATLAKNMYEGTPINVPKYNPIYWEAQAQTKGLSGSVTTLPPLRFAQKNNQDHYIYGIGYMRYQTPDKQVKTLYTDAIAATVNNPDNYTSKYEGQTNNARLMTQDFGETTAAARRAPKREAETQQEAETLDMSTVTAPQSQLTVYVDGIYSASLSDAYGYGETVGLTAPAVSDKTFSYWTTDDGAVISTDQTLTLTINAHTTLQAVYDGESKTANPAITSATRSNDGQNIAVQAIATGTFDAAGFVYSITATEPTIGAADVTQVAAVKYSSLSNELPASVLDKNNCFTFQLPVADETTIYHVRAYATTGGSTTYGDVKDVKLADLESGIMMVANIEAFEQGIDDELTEVQNNILILDETTDNTDALTEWNGKEATVTLKRTLVADSWNTLAVPFNVDATMLGYLKTQYGLSVKELTGSSLDGETLTLNFDDALSIEAGKPYLVKVTSDYDFSARTFPSIEVSKDLNPVSTTYADFIPTLGETTIEGVDAEDVLFVAAGNTLKNPDAMPTDMKGFRAYFLLKGEAVTARAITLNIDGETTAIGHTEITETTEKAGAWYDLQGRKINAMQKGVYIQNGKKVIK